MKVCFILCCRDKYWILLFSWWFTIYGVCLHGCCYCVTSDHCFLWSWGTLICPKFTSRKSDFEWHSITLFLVYRKNLGLPSCLECSIWYILKRCVFSLHQNIWRNSAVLSVVGRSFHQRNQNREQAWMCSSTIWCSNKGTTRWPEWSCWGVGSNCVKFQN